MSPVIRDCITTKLCDELNLHLGTSQTDSHLADKGATPSSSHIETSVSYKASRHRVYSYFFRSVALLEYRSLRGH